MSGISGRSQVLGVNYVPGPGQVQVLMSRIGRTTKHLSYLIRYQPSFLDNLSTTKAQAQAVLCRGVSGAAN